MLVEPLVCPNGTGRLSPFTGEAPMRWYTRTAIAGLVLACATIAVVAITASLNGAH